MLELSDVSRMVNGAALLSRVSLDIPAGHPTAIAGLAPVQREAFAQLLSGVDKPQAGSIRLGGKDVAQARREKGRILRIGPQGIAPSGAKVGKFIGAEAAARAGLSGKLETKTSTLTVDQRVRLAIVQAVAARPSLLVLEAPASLADPAARDALAADLPQLLSGFGGVLVLLAGGADEALSLGGTLVVLEGGGIAQAGPAADVSAHPVSLAAAAATSWPTLNRLDLRVRDGRCFLPDGSTLQLPDDLSLPADSACTLAFHPDDSTLERASPGCVRFVVRAISEEPRGARRYLRTTFAGVPWICPLAVAAPPPGAVLNAFVDRSRLMMFDAEGRALN